MGQAITRALDAAGGRFRSVVRRPSMRPGEWAVRVRVFAFLSSLGAVLASSAASFAAALSSLLPKSPTGGVPDSTRPASRLASAADFLTAVANTPLPRVARPSMPRSAASLGGAALAFPKAAAALPIRAAVASWGFLTTSPAPSSVQRVENKVRRAGRGPRRRVVLLASLTVAVVAGAGMGLTGALAAVGDPPFYVTSTTDAPDSAAMSSCTNPANTNCTLRAAIQRANSRAGADIIYVNPGTYSIAIPPNDINSGAVGDFDISGPVTIEKRTGTAGAVIVDGGTPPAGSSPEQQGLDRVFEIHPGAGDVTLRNLTIQNGFHEEEGGGIQNWSLAKLTLEGVTVKDSYASKAGGGLNHADLNDYEWATEPPNLALLPLGRVEIKGSTFTGNGSGGGSGGAINNVSGGTITISDASVITLNPGPIVPDPLDPEQFVLKDPSDYPIAASAIANQGRWGGVGTITIVDSTVSLNAAEGGGAGIANWGDGIVTVQSSTITGNRTEAEGGGLFSEGGTTTVLNSTITNNQAANGGGLYSGGHVTAFGLRGSFTVRGSQFSENVAENGGGLYSGGEGQLVVSDTTFTRNHSSDHGAAITSEDRASMTLTRVTVHDNESWGEAGGIWTHSERPQLIEDSTFTANDSGVPHIEDNELTDDVAGGGALHTDGGPVTILRSKFEGNTATEEGGGLSIHNLGDVLIADSTISRNRAEDGGGTENSATQVTFERVTIQGNHADVHGGGIYNTSSGPFYLVDSTIRENVGVVGGGLANAPDNDLIIRGSLFLNNNARLALTEEGEIDENAGLGGGIMSLADGDSLIENTTISGNRAGVGGGGFFHDADGELRVVHTTIWRNAAPKGGGIGVVESDFVPDIPPKTNAAVVLKNSIVGASQNGGNCDWYIRSEGGNVETGDKHTCFLAVTAQTAQNPIELGVRDRLGTVERLDLWAIADNGGPTMTHALQYGSLAIDSSTVPCSDVDQRGTERPQNGRCDAGAYEFVGDAPTDDDVAPETFFVRGPFQDGIETMAFEFRGEDPSEDALGNPITHTAPDELNFECRLLEIDLVEQQEPVAPWDPVPPELRWNGCSSPWSVPLYEEGMFQFEVRAVDQNDNIDPTPVQELIAGLDMTPPQTLIVEGPGIPNGQTVPPYAPATPFQTNNRSALFSFTGISDFTPAQFMEFECRLDSRDPAMWLECTNPAMFSNLSTGWHEFEVRALAGEAAGPDPTPARWRWHVGPNEDLVSTEPLNCDQANVTLTASADGWADEVNPLENYLFMTELEVRSAQGVGPTGATIGANARAFFRFPLTNDAPDCELESATLRLYASSHTEGRDLLAVPLEDTWKESTLTWANQPDPLPGATPASAESGELYREWDVLEHVNAIFAGGSSNGWVIRDASETDAAGGDQAFLSREMPQDPPDNTLPELELRFEPADPEPQDPRVEPTTPTIVHCGQVLTESTLVHPASDLSACLGEGLAIGAPNVILDLNGQTIQSGIVLEAGEEDGLTPGVRNSYANVEIRNGTIKGFGYGVLLGPGATHNDVHDLTLFGNALAGIQLFDADDGRNGNRVYHNLIDSNGESGIQLMSGSEGSEIYENTLKSNGVGIHLNAARANTIRDNQISGIIVDPLLDSDAGIVVENGSRLNVLRNNNVSDTGDAGVVIHQGSHDTRIEGGVFVRNGDAGVIAQGSDRIYITGITSHQQSDGGIVLQDSSGSSVIGPADLRFNPSGIEAANTNGLRVEGVDASNSLQAGIGLGNGIGMVIKGNTANQTGGSGISLEGAAFDAAGNPVGGALIESNTANQNFENGLTIADGGHTIRDNDAHNNAGFGILAGEVDGGGTNIDGPPLLTNRATGNGEFVQCLGVVCDETGGLGLLANDVTPPETEITSGPGVLTSDETAVFEFSAVDPDNADGSLGTPLTAMVFECRLDAPPDPVVVEPPDLEPPEPGAEAPEPIEGEGWAECVSPHTILGLEPGTAHHLEVRAVDQTGNWDLTPARYDWEISPGADDEDTFEDPPVPPDTKITSAPGEPLPLVNEDNEPVLDETGTQIVYTATTNRSASLSFLGSDNLTAGYRLVYECRHHYDQYDAVLEATDVPGTLAWQPCESPTSLPAYLMDGVGASDPVPAGVDPANTNRLLYGGHIFQVRAVDRAGNEDITPASHSWWIQPPPPDTEPPVTEIVSGPDPTTALTTATFELTGTDNQTPTEELDYQCRLDPNEGDAWLDCTSPHPVTVSNSTTSATTHILQVRAVDATGNPDESPEAYVWDVSAAPVNKTIFCGQKITQSIIVNNNLGDCLGHGLIVGASGITIDLNGKTIDGKSIGAGILNNGYDSVTIKNGRLMDFDYGVMLNNGAQLNIVEGVTLQQSQDAGVGLGQPTFPEDPNLSPGEPAPGFQSQVNGNILRSNTFVANNRGIWLLNGASGNVALHNTIGQTAGEAVFIDRASSNHIEGNDIQVAGKVGVLLEGATNNVVLDNSVVDIGTGILVSATTTGTTGIESTGNRIEGNLISDGGPSLRINLSSSNELIDNVGVESDAYAIELYLADDNLVRGNDVSGNKGGISISQSSGNRFEENNASESDSTGITIESGSFNNVLLENESSNNEGGGIYIGIETPSGQGTLVQGNVTNANKGMGIQVSKPSHIFVDNAAFDNESWGIYAGDPSNGRANVDGGGNVAQGNKGPLGTDLKPQQCYNITCSGGPGGGDAIDPSTTILEAPFDGWPDSLVEFRFTGADNATPVTFECRFYPASTPAQDIPAFSTCASPTTYPSPTYPSALTNGTYTFEVRARDFSGNVDETPASHTFTVELGDLLVTITSKPDKVTVDTDATFEFSASPDTGVTFECVVVEDGQPVDWGTAPACTSPQSYTGLEPDTAYRFYVQASNGGVSPDSTASYAWTIGPPPVATEVFCGQILMQSTTLVNDLTDCGGYGLIVGTSGITIDLDGHFVDGMGLDAGIFNNGHDDVTITNGLVREFLNGVQLNPGSLRNVVSNMRVEMGAEAGIALGDADDASILNNSLVGNEYGIALYSGTRGAVVRGNTLSASNGEGGIYVEFAQDNLIEQNQLANTGGHGIFIAGGGDNSVLDNVIKQSGGYGIAAGDATLQSNGNLVRGNTIQAGGGGIIVGGANSQIVNNDVSGTTGPGVALEIATGTLVRGNDFGGNASGIALAQATGNTIEANNASGTLGSGIEIGELSWDNVVRQNTASGNGGAGIEVTENTVLNQGNEIVENNADANGGDGIYVEGSGHTIADNAAHLNGGWGIYYVGPASGDGGGNVAVGNMEIDQCFGIVCGAAEIDLGAPDTWIVSGPADVVPDIPGDPSTLGVQSNSRNASFTYMGADDFSAITELVFECRIDSTNALAWEDCEYPAEFLNLSPGAHRVEIRAIDQMGAGIPDPTPAVFEWTYVPLPTGVAPQAIIDIAPPKETPLPEGVFTFHSNEPDVTFQCQVDTLGWQPCGFEGAAAMSQGAFEVALEPTAVGLHTFRVRAIDFEGNVSVPSVECELDLSTAEPGDFVAPCDIYTWTLIGITVAFTDGPGFTPATGGPAGDPATGGPTASTSAEIHFESNAGDAIFWCRFDDPVGTFFPCESPFRVGPGPFSSPFPATHDPEPLAVGEHVLEIFAESETMASAAELETAVYEWEVVATLDEVPPETTISLSPTSVGDLSSTTFEFAGTDNMTPSFMLTFQCQLTSGTALPNGNDWVDCFSPFNLLDVYEPLLLTEQTFWVRAFDLVDPEFPNPLQPDFAGNPDPTPASHTWTPVADTIGPSVFISGGIGNGATVGALDLPFEFVGEDNATPDLMIEFECAVGVAPLDLAFAAWAPCDSPYSLSSLEPGFQYTFAVRGIDLAQNRGPTLTRTFTLAAAPVVTILSGPLGQNGTLPFASTENAVFTFSSDQASSTFECSLDGAEFAPCNTASGTPDQFVQAYWVVTSGAHEFAVRATNAQGVLGEEAVYAWTVQLGPDTAEPNTKTLTGPANGTLSQEGVFTFTGEDNRTPAANLVFECELDLSGAWSSCVSPQQYSDFTRGEHTIRVRAIDAAGNIETTPASYTWTVAPPPFVTITGGPGIDPSPEASTDTTATFTFTSDVGGVTFECWLDGAFNPPQGTDCISPVTYTDLGLGPHLFAVRAIDGFGNIGEWEDAEFTVIPPQAVITVMPATGESTTATFEFAADPADPDAAFFCALDGGNFGLCESPRTYNNLWPGEHTFQVHTVYTGVDWRGEPLEFQPVIASHTWTVQDFTAPDTFIDFGPPATTVSTTAHLQVSSDDFSATIACELDGVLVDCEPGVVITLEALAVGPHTFTATATDTALPPNVDPSPATHSWTVQAAGPANTLTGTNVIVSEPPVTVTFASVEAQGTTTVQALTGGPSLPEGYGTSNTLMYDISTTALFTEPVTVCVEYDPDAFGGIQAIRLLHFDGELWLDITTTNNPFTTPATVCGLAESFSLFAVAAAGEGLGAKASILSGPTGPLNAEGLPTSTSGSATFTFWVDQPNAQTQCSIDGLPFVFCESPFTVGPLEAGGHEFVVQAISELGLPDLMPAIYEWEVIGPDVTPPDTSITSGPTEGSSTPNFISWFGFSGTDDFTPALDFDFQCWLDGVDLGNCENPEDIAVTTPGDHTLEVAAIDAAGNVDLTPASRTWTVVDMSGPDTEITLAPEEETTETSATFEFIGYELLDSTPVNQFECALDGGEFASCTSPYVIAGPLAAGAHSFQVRAIDLDLNIDISPAFHTWLIVAPPDETPPNTFIVTHPPVGNSGPDVLFGFASDEPVESFECALDQATPTTWQECGTVWELLGLTSGQHTLWVRSIDIAGNVDPTPAGADLGNSPDATPFTWVTVGEPDTTITSGPDDPTAEFTATFTFESSQEGATFQCSQNGFPFVPCTSPYQTGPFLPGENGEPLVHEFEVRAVNQYLTAEGAQVMDLTPALYTWTVQDNEPPDTEFLGSMEIGQEQFLEPGLRFSFRGDDNGGTSSLDLEFECLIDNTSDVVAATWETCGELGAGDSFFHDVVFADLLTDPGAGEYTFQVRAIDVGANIDPSPAPAPGDANYDESTFVIEAEPETAIDSVTPDLGVDLQTDATTVTFTFSSPTAGATFACALDSTTFTPCESGTPYTDVPYGTHLFRVMALAPFGTPDPSPAELEWTSGHLTAPPVQIDSGPELTTDSPDATFAFSSTDVDAAFRCSLDGAPFASCLSPRSYTGLQAGVDHTFEVEATKANLLAEPNVATYTWTIEDNVEPETQITLAPPLTSGPDVTIQFAGTDNGAGAITFECSLDGAAFAGCSSPLALSGLAGGAHTFEVRAVDGAGHFDMSPASAIWNVVAPPDTTITSGPDQPTSAVDTATFAFADQPGSTYECRLDPADETAPWTACASGVTYNGLSNGAHLFEVRAIAPPLNGVSVTEDTPAEWAWNVNVADTTDPNTSIQLGPADPTTSTSATFFFTGTDNATAPGALTFECSLDGAAFASCTSGVTYTGLSATAHTFEVRATDAALNVEDTPAGYGWTIVAGTTNTPTGTGVDVDLGNGATATFAQVTSAGVTTYTDLTGAPSLPTSYSNAIFFDISTTAGYAGSIEICVPYETASLDEPHMLHYDGGWTDVTSSIDPVGGTVCGIVTSLSPFALAEAAAEIAPTTTIESGPPATTYSTAATFSFSSNDSLASFECSLDGSGWSSCDNPKTFNGLLPGEHELFARAKNAAGNVDHSPAKHVWEILPLPETSLVTTVVDQLASEAGNQTQQTDAQFTLGSDQAGSTFQCRLETDTNTPSWSACTSPVIYSDLTLGEYSFEARAINADGEVDPTPAEYEWEVADLTAPVATLTGPASPVDSKSATFEFSANEPSTFECSLDGAPFGVCVSPPGGITYTGLGLGNHTFQVRATDQSARQNVGDIATHNWTVADLTDPTVSIGQTPGSQINQGQTATFTFSGSDNWTQSVTFECRVTNTGSGDFAACTSPHAIADMQPGTYVFDVRSKDGAGRTSAVASHSWTVNDTDPPETTSSMAGGSITFTFSGTDNHTSAANLSFQCKLDGGSWFTCQSPHTYTTEQLQQMVGNHAFQIRAVDQAGNVDPTPESHDFSVTDTTSPDTSLTGQPTNNTTNPDASFTFTGSDNTTATASLTYECALDGGAFAACTSPKAYTGLSVGQHTFQVRAKDAAGLVDPTPASYTWTIQQPADESAPDTTITAQPPATTTLTSASFQFTSNETGATFECKLDSAAFAACTSPQSYSNLTTGTHTFSVRAKDAAGNIDQTPASYSWTIGSASVDCGSQQTLTANADAWIDSGSTSSNKGSDSVLKVMSKSGGNLRALVRFNLPAMPQGCSVETATLRLFAASAGTGRTIQVLQLGGSWSEGGVTWANQPATTGGAATTSSGTGWREWNVAGIVQQMVTGSNDGFLVRDATENQDAEQQFNSREKSSDRPTLILKYGTGSPPPPPPPPGGGSNAAPDTQITGSPLAATQANDATFTFTGSDDSTPASSLTFQCQLDVADTAPWTACTSPRSYNNLAQGSHIFRVRAVDGAGLADPQPAVFTWAIDQTSPETVISTGPGATTTNTGASFEFLASNETSGITFECALDSAAFAACTSPKAYTGLSVGEHTFQVRAKDAAGNVDPTPASYPWTIQPGGTPVSCGPSQTMNATADAWIDSGSTSQNKGDDSVLKVMSKSGSNLRALVRFDLPTVPTGCVVDTATLRLYAGSSASGRSIEALRLDGSWTEGGVNWSNQPSTTGSEVSTDSGSGYRSWNVSLMVDAMYSSNANNGFLVKDANENQDAEQQFYSREKGENPPELVVTFKPA